MSNSVDFLIVTPLAEERDAMLAQLPGWRKMPPTEDDIRTYYSAALPVDCPGGQGFQYSVIVIPLANMGHVEAANATADAIRQWRPRFVLLVGIAGGSSAAGVRLGDILVADQVANYELQKIRDGKSSIRWQVHRVDQRLLIAAQNFETRSWASCGASQRPVPGEPQVHFGPICTGDKVIADEGLASTFRDVWARLIGFEMEAGGVASASFQAASIPGFLMIRGVSDLADAHKDSPEVEEWRPYACAISAAYASRFLMSGPVPNKSKEVSDNLPEEPAGPLQPGFSHNQLTNISQSTIVLGTAITIQRSGPEENKK
jgi:nucleoside phosphorylase